MTFGITSNLLANKVLYLLTLIFSINFNTYGDTCEKLPKAILYQNADLVFLGFIKTKKIDSNPLGITYKVYVLENFKNTETDSILLVAPGLENFIKENQIYLIYCNNTENEIYYTDVCMGTRGFEMPFGIYDYPSPIPPNKEISSDSKSLKLYEQNIESRMLQSLDFEIIKLYLKNLNDNILAKLNYLLIINSIIIVLLIILVIKRVR